MARGLSSFDPTHRARSTSLSLPSTSKAPPRLALQVAVPFVRPAIATCQRVKIDTFANLRDVLGRLAAHPVNKLDELLPVKGKPAKA